MDERSKRRFSYVVASFPLVATVLQVAFGTAPVAMLWFGAAMAVVAFLLFRFLAGIRTFKPGMLQFGRSSTLRLWQAPVVWVPIVVTVAAVVFLGYVV